MITGLTKYASTEQFNHEGWPKMRLANVDGRLKLIVEGGSVDVESASAGQFDANPQAAYGRIDELRQWSTSISSSTEPFDPSLAGPPAPAPRQIFAIGLNYADHAAESGFAKPSDPVVFTKFVSSLSGPVSQVSMPAGSVDWEIEVVVVIGTLAQAVSVEHGWRYVAGLTAGQDLSERQLQRSGPAPQFSLAKSFAGFAPIGPVVVSVDEFTNPDDLELGCTVNGVEMQKGRTSDMIFSIPEIVSYLSHVVTLYPGDLIFTGTPKGVGMGRTPPVYLRAGDVLHSWIEGIGELEQRMVAGSPADDGQSH
jgi:2,4-diketo-3-deoxy-L-fuconate hydrolase